MRKIIFLIIIIFGLKSYSFDQSLRKIKIYEEQSYVIPTFDRIKQCFHMTIANASKELGIGTSKIKKICRQNNLKRWPGRKIKKINNWLINAPDNEKNNILREELLKIIEKDILKAIECFEKHLSKNELNKSYCNKKNSVKNSQDEELEQSLTEEENSMEIDDESNTSEEDISVYQFANKEEGKETKLEQSLTEEENSMEVNDEGNTSEEDISVYQFANEKETEEFLQYRLFAEKNINYTRLF